MVEANLIDSLAIDVIIIIIIDHTDKSHVKGSARYQELIIEFVCTHRTDMGVGLQLVSTIRDFFWHYYIWGVLNPKQ